MRTSIIRLFSTFPSTRLCGNNFRVFFLNKKKKKRKNKYHISTGFLKISFL